MADVPWCVLCYVKWPSMFRGFVIGMMHIGNSLFGWRKNMKKQQHIFVPSGDEICDVPWWKKIKLHLYPHSRSQEWLIVAIVVLWLSIVGGLNPQPIWKMWCSSNWIMKPHRVGVKLSRKGAHLPFEPSNMSYKTRKRMCFATGKSLATRHNKCDFYAILGDMFTFYEVEVCFNCISDIGFSYLRFLPVG